MLSLLKRNSAKKLQRRYNARLTEAMNAQRNGDLARFAELSEEADTLARELESLEQVNQEGR